MPDPNANDWSTVLASLAGAFPRLDRRVLEVFLEELFRWNPQLGLVSKRDTPAVVSRLVEQSVHLWDFIVEATPPEAARLCDVADIGSGAGFPGLVWKMLDPALQVELIERKERKVAFLERVIARTALPRVTATAADLRDLARREDRKGSLDLAVMIAVTDPENLAAPVERLLRTRGFFCFVRGREQTTPGEQLEGTALCRKAVRETAHGRFFLYETTPTE
jgi:16S rRNA (guanine527-N7)-methyltransferase